MPFDEFPVPDVNLVEFRHTLLDLKTAREKHKLCRWMISVVDGQWSELDRTRNAEFVQWLRAQAVMWENLRRADEPKSKMDSKDHTPPMTRSNLVKILDGSRAAISKGTWRKLFNDHLVDDKRASFPWELLHHHCRLFWMKKRAHETDIPKLADFKKQVIDLCSS